MLGAATDRSPLLRVQDLHTYFHDPGGLVRAVAGCSFDLLSGEMLGITGPSGAGKSALARSVLGVVHAQPGVVRGQVLFRGQALLPDLDSICALTGDDQELRVEKDLDGWERQQRRSYARRLRRRMAAIFQHPELALEPWRTIGGQLGGVIRDHGAADARTPIAQRTFAWLERVGLRPAEIYARRYPFEMSGGECQRAALACAAAARPELLVADEPTSQLDCFIEEEILSLLRDLSRTAGTGVLVISHRIGALVRHCDRLIALRAGEIVDQGHPQEVAARLGWKP